MSIAAVILWGHACAALLFAGLAAARLRDRASRLPRTGLVAACALTALWALAAAGIDSHDVVTRMIESARNIAWFAFLHALLGRTGWAARATFAALTALCVATAAVAVLEALVGAAEFSAARLAMRLVAGSAGLALAVRLLAAAPAGQGGLRLALLALAGMWSVELLGFAAALAAGGWPASLVALRGLAMVGVAAALGVAMQRGGDWTLRLSRGLAFRAAAVAAVAAYVVVVALAIQLLAGFGSGTRPLQAAFVAGATALLVAAFASSWVRGWLKVKVAKHLFDHRYDYRAEWLRCTGTLGHPGPLPPRIAQALADLTDSPAALLLAASDDGLVPLGGWNWAGTEGVIDGALAETLAARDWVLELDALRADAATLPGWLVDERAAWVLVPLLHLGRLLGAVVLARPPVVRALDWEDFDLLRTAGRQAASHLAEDRAAVALGEAQRFDEFNRRFAFIVHDVKNLVSQLSLTARNAERHADNPAFRADMIATLQESCGRLSTLLTRLSQQPAATAPLRATDLAALAARVAGRAPRVVVNGGGVALVDPARFEQALGHLVQNALEASPPEAAVTVVVADAGAHVVVTVTDSGAGMAPAFVRDELFRPFASSKPGGFGIGAFEARQLVRAMHGTLAVASRPGRGTTFTLAFPAAPAFEEAA